MSIVAAFLMCLHSMFGVHHGYTQQQINQAVQASGATTSSPGYDGYVVVVDTIYQN